MKPRHWFHCTTAYRGLCWTARRIPPPFTMAASEPRTPRLCVCSSVARCFAARIQTAGDVYVYRTAKPRRGIPARAVWDAVVTGEHWLVPPVEMNFFGLVPAPLARRACAGTIAACREALAAGRSSLAMGVRVRGLLEACEVLGGQGEGFVAGEDLRFARAVLADAALMERLG